MSGGPGWGSSDESDRGVDAFRGEACLVLVFLIVLSVALLDDVVDSVRVSAKAEVLSGSCVSRALDDRRRDIELRPGNAVNCVLGPQCSDGGKIG